MKKILILALLVVSAAFAPGLRDAVEFPERACEVAQEVARPLFWHLWDELLTRQLARGNQPATRSGSEPEWPVALHSDAVVCIFLHVFLKHAFDGVVSVGEKNNTLLVSIPSDPIRRTVKNGFSSYLNTRQLTAESNIARRSS